MNTNPAPGPPCDRKIALPKPGSLWRRLSCARCSILHAASCCQPPRDAPWLKSLWLVLGRSPRARAVHEGGSKPSGVSGWPSNCATSRLRHQDVVHAIFPAGPTSKFSQTRSAAETKSPQEPKQIGDLSPIPACRWIPFVVMRPCVGHHSLDWPDLKICSGIGAMQEEHALWMSLTRGIPLKKTRCSSSTTLR